MRRSPKPSSREHPHGLWLFPLIPKFQVTSRFFSPVFRKKGSHSRGGHASLRQSQGQAGTKFWRLASEQSRPGEKLLFLLVPLVLLWGLPSSFLPLEELVARLLPFFCDGPPHHHCRRPGLALVPLAARRGGCNLQSRVSQLQSFWRES